MTDIRSEIERLLDAGRPDRALQQADRAQEAAPDDLGLMALRVRCLADVGQFEIAMDVARALLVRDPGNETAHDVMRVIAPTMEAPPRGSEDPRARAYRSELPTPMLQRLQQALHHQTYRGVQTVKNPFDLLLYQQLIWNLRPGTIIEIGSKAGGSGLYFGDLLANFGIDGHVRSFDVVPPTGVSHPAVTYEYGNGRALEESLSDQDIAAMARPFLIVEDADHTEETTRAVLDFFDRHLRPGDWMIVEDGNLSDIYPEQYPNWTSGPHKALKTFLRERGDAYRAGAEYADFYAYNGTTASNGFLERVEAGG
jgi:cephalosporin hydroxylase